MQSSARVRAVVVLIRVPRMLLTRIYTQVQIITNYNSIIILV